MPLDSATLTIWSGNIAQTTGIKRCGDQPANACAARAQRIASLARDLLQATRSGHFDDGGAVEKQRPVSINRLAQRVIAALSVPTAAGALYEVDTRLRPSGAQGPIAVSLDSFERYQREDAWTWEHMALCRARALYGIAEARAKLADIIERVLQTPRDADTLRADVLEMRGEMARHKPPKGPLDVKLARGGLVDLEFLLHFVQLRERGALDTDIGTALSTMEARTLVPAGLRAAHDLLARLLVVVRLVAPDGLYPPEASRGIVARSCGLPDWDALLDAITEARQRVAEGWTLVFGEQLEID